MNTGKIDLDALDALFDSGEVDMEPYMVPGATFRPYLEALRHRGPR